MVKSLQNREAQPIVLENPKRVGDYIQGGLGAIDFYNMFDASILVGEPFIMYDKVSITKNVIEPLSVGSLHHGAWMNFLADPDLVAPILFGDKVYYDLDLADSEVPGYVTNVVPTNGIFVGHAVTPHEQRGTLQLDATTGKPIVCDVGQARCGVLMHTETMVWGENFFGLVPDYVNGDSVISS
jgi:hypothetical protein